MDQIKNFQKLVQRYRLLAGLQADTHGIVADHNGQDRRGGKLEGAKSKIEAAENSQRSHRGRMAAGHAAVTKQTGNIQFLGLQGINYCFEHLGHKPGRQAHQQKSICQQVNQPIHRGLLLFFFSNQRNHAFYMAAAGEEISGHGVL